MGNVSEQSAKIPDLLLVEDSPSDAQLVLEALEEYKVKCRVHIVDNGESALEYLRQARPEAGQCLPDLILLDLNLPRKDGREVLQEIKGDAGLAFIPVIVMSTSSSDKDIKKCYDLHANSFIVKPLNLNNFLEKMKVFFEYWFSVCHLKRP